MQCGTLWGCRVAVTNLLCLMRMGPVFRDQEVPPRTGCMKSTAVALPLQDYYVLPRHQLNRRRPGSSPGESLSGPCGCSPGFACPVSGALVNAGAAYDLFVKEWCPP